MSHIFDNGIDFKKKLLEKCMSLIKQTAGNTLRKIELQTLNLMIAC
jgi:hypothetical protein